MSTDFIVEYFSTVENFIIEFTQNKDKTTKEISKAVMNFTFERRKKDPQFLYAALGDINKEECKTELFIYPTKKQNSREFFKQNKVYPYISVGTNSAKFSITIKGKETFSRIINY